MTAADGGGLDVRAIRRHFAFPPLGRVATNNAASTQPPRELLELYSSLGPGYENVHRGQSAASQRMTALFEGCYDTIAEFIGAPGGLAAIPGITIYGPRAAARRTSLVAFNLAGHDPVSVAETLNRSGVESRAGCHCATLAHHALGLTPPASCRLSFYLYNTPAEVDRAVAAVAAVAGFAPLPVPYPRSSGTRPVGSAAHHLISYARRRQGSEPC